MEMPRLRRRSARYMDRVEDRAGDVMGTMMDTLQDRAVDTLWNIEEKAALARHAIERSGRSRRAMDRKMARLMRAMESRAEDTGQALAEKASETGQMLAGMAADTGQMIAERMSDTGQTLVDKAADVRHTLGEKASTATHRLQGRLQGRMPERNWRKVMMAAIPVVLSMAVLAWVIRKARSETRPRLMSRQSVPLDQPSVPVVQTVEWEHSQVMVEEEPELYEESDLKRIEGIGPKIETILKNMGIRTYRDLARTDTAYLTQILNDHGIPVGLANPETWPEQADLADRGMWEELNTLQSRLSGGRARGM